MSEDAPKNPRDAKRPAQDEPAATPLSPEDADRRRRQLELLNHFGTIDFDPDWDPIKRRDRDREKLKQEIARRS